MKVKIPLLEFGADRGGAGSDMRGLRQARLAAVLVILLWILSPKGSTSAPQQKSVTFNQLAEKAKSAKEESRLDEAAGLYARALALQPKWAEGWWSLGTLEYDQDHYSKAAVDFKKLIALQPKDGTAHAMLGLCEFELKEDDSALKNLLAAKWLGVLNDEQLRRVTLYHLALLQARARKFGDAQGSLKSLMQLGVNSDEVLLLNGEVALKVRPEEAPQEGTPGRDVLLRVGRAEMLKVQKKVAAANEEYLALAAEYPDYPNLHFAFGRFLIDASEPDESIPHFEKELQVNPQNVNVLLAIAEAHYRIDSTKGVKYAEEAVRISPQLPFAHYLLGVLYLDSGNTVGAISQLEIAKRGFANKPEVYFALGNAYARAGRKQEAAQARATFQRLSKQAGGESPSDSEGNPSNLDPRRLGPKTDAPVQPSDH